MILSIDAENACDDIVYPFIIKTLSKPKAEDNLQTLRKGTCEKLQLTSW